MNAEGIRDECRCGHDRASHYGNTARGEQAGGCLVLGCNCSQYAHAHAHAVDSKHETERNLRQGR